MKIKCPTCQHVINPADSAMPNRLECPVCEHVWTTAESRNEPGHARGQTTPPELPVFIEPTDNEQPSKRPPKDSGAKAEYPRLGSDAAGLVPRFKNAKPADPILDVYQRKRKRQRIIQACAMAVLAAATIIVTLFVALNQEPRRAADQDESTKPDTAAQASPPDGSAVATDRDDSEIQTPPARQSTGLLDGDGAPNPLDDGVSASIPKIEYRQPPRRLLSQAKLNEAWQRLQPHLVRLEAETPFGTRIVPGLLVDSRGWVVTSYRAVADASLITAYSLPPSDDQTPLVDRVRGWLAADVDHDLVMLLVNRRFVTSLRDPSVATEDRVVSSQHLIHVTVPTDAFPWGVSECRVARKRLNELSLATQKQLAAKGLDDPAFEWLTHEVHSPSEGGSLIVDTTGVVQAVNIQLHASPVDEHEVLAVPARWIQALKKNAKPDPSPLPIQSGRGNGAGPDMANAEADRPDNGIPVCPPNSPHRDLSIALNRMGMQCATLGWWPESDAAAERLAEFVSVLSEARSLAENSDTAPDETKTLDAQTQYWWNRLVEELTPPKENDGAAAVAFQKSMDGRWQHPGPFLAVASIKLAAIVSPPIRIETEAADESVTFEAVHGDSIWIANTRQGWPVLRPETHWLVWGVERRGQFHLQNDAGNDINRLRPAVVYGLSAPDWIR